MFSKFDYGFTAREKKKRIWCLHARVTSDAIRGIPMTNINVASVALFDKILNDMVNSVSLVTVSILSDSRHEERSEQCHAKQD